MKIKAPKKQRILNRLVNLIAYGSEKRPRDGKLIGTPEQKRKLLVALRSL